MRRRGFTLIELMVVILLLSLTAAVAAPRLRSAIPGANLRGAGQRLAGDLRYLYGYAVTRRTHVRLAIDLNAGEYWAETFEPRERDDDGSRVVALQLRTDFTLAPPAPDADATKVAVLQDAIVGRHALPRGVKFVTVQVAGGDVERGGTVYIEFSPWGYGDDAAIRLAMGDAERTIRLVGLLGEAAVVKAGT